MPTVTYTIVKTNNKYPAYWIVKDSGYHRLSIDFHLCTNKS